MLHSPPLNSLILINYYRQRNLYKGYNDRKQKKHFYRFLENKPLLPSLKLEEAVLLYQNFLHKWKKYLIKMQRLWFPTKDF